MPTPAQLDPRTYDDLVQQIELGVQECTKECKVGWSPAPAGKLDAGGALVRVFARMMEQLIARLNQVPEQHHHAFLDLLGVERLPPSPARVPLTFLLSEPRSVDPAIPAQTSVHAPAEDGLPEVAFQTEQDLTTTRAQLVAVLTYDAPSGMFQDVTAVAQGVKSDAFPAFGSATAARSRALALLFPMPNVDTTLRQLTFYFDFDAETQAEICADLELKWKYFDGHTECVMKTVQTRSGKRISWLCDPPQQLRPFPLPQLAGACLRAELRANAQWTRPRQAVFALREQFAPLQSPVLVFNGHVLDPSADFQPFGGNPRANDTLYIGGHEHLLAPGAVVTLTWTLSDALWGTSGSALCATPDLRLSFEVWQGNRWTPLSPGAVQDQSRAMSFSGCAAPTVNTVLTLPESTPAVTATLIDGKTRCWLRVRIVAGGYGMTADELAKPVPSKAEAKTDSAETADWRYVVIAISSEGALQPSEAFVRKGPLKLETTSPLSIAWEATAKAVTYAVYRVQGHSPAATGYIGSTTGTVFLDCGQQPGPAPALVSRPTCPSLKSASIDFGERARDASATVIIDEPSALPSEPHQSALYLGFDRPFANRSVCLFLELDGPKADEVAEAASPASQSTLQWEYFSGAVKKFVPLPVQDDTLTLTRSGQLQFLGPGDLERTVVNGQSGFFLRVRLFGTLTPERRLRRVLTNTTWAIQAKTIRDEVIGSSSGLANQSFFLSQRPILPGERIEVRELQPPSVAERAAMIKQLGPDCLRTIPATRTMAEELWVRWLPVPDFHASGPLDRHYVLDRHSGELRFGNGQAGRIPPPGTRSIRVGTYQTGGGAIGNRPAAKVTQLKTSISHVEGVINHCEAAGGADAEPPERWKKRAASQLRHRQRAVTLEDFQDLALAASPSVARAIAIGAQEEPAAGRVLVVIVPYSTASKPVPSIQLLDRVREHLRARCIPDLRLLVTGPRFQEVNVTATLQPTNSSHADQVWQDAKLTIRSFLHPQTGNADGQGWPFGRQPHGSDIYRALASVRNLQSIRSLSLEVVAPAVKDLSNPVHTLICPGAMEIKLDEGDGGD